MHRGLENVSRWFSLFFIFAWVLFPVYSATAGDHEGKHEIKQRLDKIEDEEKGLDEKSIIVISTVAKVTFGGFVELSNHPV